MTIQRAVVVGIDLGGSNVRVVATDQTGQALRTTCAPVTSVRSLEDLAELAGDVLTPAWTVSGIGVGATGPVDAGTGIVDNPHTLPERLQGPLGDVLERRWQCPVTLLNDADAAALGEWWLGAGRGIDRLACVTVGTGIGLAFLRGGRLDEGPHGEAGHHVLDPAGPRCYCGANGCWEVLCAGPAIVTRARHKLENGTVSSALTLTSSFSGVAVTDAARAGDPLAAEVVEETAALLGLGLVNTIAFLAPARIVLGGGVMRDFDLFEPLVRRVLARHRAMVPTAGVSIVPAALGNRAGALGAAYAALERRDGLSR